MKRRRKFYHDVETWSEMDLPKVGASRYARHSSTEIQMCAYAFDDEDIEQWIAKEPGDPISAEIEDALLDERVEKIAWNKSFEYCIFKHVSGITVPHREWRDMMIRAHYISLPGSLEKAGKIIGLDALDQKAATRGKLLINTFCKPRKPTKMKPWTRTMPQHEPEKWDEFCWYNRQDVHATREFDYETLAWELPEEEWELWFLDQKINEYGIPINMAVVDNAIAVANDILNESLNKMANITRLNNPNSGAQLLPWLRKYGYPYADLKKAHVKAYVDELEADAKADPDSLDKEDHTCLKVLKLRQITAKSSIKKYNSLKQHCDDDERLRYSLQFMGAQRTARWSGRTYQPQNLARPIKSLEEPEQLIAAVNDLERLSAKELTYFYDDVMGLLSSCVRPVAQAPEGYVLVDADLNAIENRVLGWMAGDRKILKVFRDNRCPYVDFATYLYGQSYDILYKEYKSGDKAKRTMAKPGVLGCGYMLGPGKYYIDQKTGEKEATGLLGYAKGMFIELTPKQAKHSVETWRATFKDAVKFWRKIGNAAFECVATGKEQTAGPLAFDMSGPFMRMILPSERCLHYFKPAIKKVKTPWGEMRDNVVYWGLQKGKWVRQTTHPGKWTENADQAIARDCLAHGMTLAAEEGLRIPMHVHDQIVGLVREDEAEEYLKILLECMRTVPSWGRGLPLNAEGSITPVFMKD